MHKTHCIGYIEILIYLIDVLMLEIRPICENEMFIEIIRLY